MIPGQKVIYDIVREKVVVKEVNVDVETCWKDGRLIFRNTPFEDILKSLSKRYNVEFILKKASLKQNSFYGYIYQTTFGANIGALPNILEYSFQVC